MLLLNKDDMLRHQLGLKSKPAEALVKKGSRFVIPMPAAGEALIKIREKHRDSFKEIMAEFDRLLDNEFFTISYVKDATTYEWARRLCSEKKDSRDWISPMDALITASAIVDEKCATLYTTDTTLLMDLDVLDDVNEWRLQRNIPKLKIRSVYDVIKQ